MGFIFSSLWKDIARWRQDPTAILLWLGIPFLVGGLITAMMDSGGSQPNGVLLIVDRDESFLSGLVAGAYSQGGMGDMISVETVALEEGNTRIEAGEASGMLVIPDGFGTALLESTPVTLTLKTNPSQTILPGIITDVTEILLDAGFYLQQLFGDEIKAIANADETTVPDDVFVAAIAVAIQQKIDQAAPHLFPPAIDLSIAEAPDEQPGVPIALLFLPGIILMAILFAATSLAEDFWAERELGTLRRLVSTPGRLPGFVLGKALAAAAVVMVVAGVALVVGFIYHGLPWSRLPSSLLWVATGGVGLFAWLGVLQMALPSRKGATLISLVIVFPLLMAGGSFFPLAALPDWMAAVGRYTPNGFIADRLTMELTATSAWSIDLSSWLASIAVALSGLYLCSMRLRHGFAQA